MEQVQRQQDEPLFPQIFWNRPTMKSRGGRLLIIGGHKHEFAQVQAIYQISEAAGIGYVQAALPDTLRRVIGGGDFGHFLPASSSGSLGRPALNELLHLADDFDALVIGANLTNNSETGILIESLIRESDRPVIITEEAIEVLKFNPLLITGNPKCVVVATMPGVFALANHHHVPLAIKPNRGVLGKIEIIDQLVSISKCSYMVFDQEVIVASDSKVSLTPLIRPLSSQPSIPIGLAATLWAQNFAKPYEALTAAAFLARAITHKDDTTINHASSIIRSELVSQEDATW